MTWERRERWLSGIKKPKQQAPAPVPVVLEVEYSVSFIPIKCPKCKSKKIRCYCSQPPIRYHKCIDCDCNFKSVEEP